MLKQSLQQKLLQKLSPQQIQMIKLLEIPALQMEQRIKKELEENPVLEEGSEDSSSDDEFDSSEENSNEKDEFSIEDYMDDDDVPSYRLNAQNYSKDDKNEEIPFSGGSSFKEHLSAQLGLHNLSEDQELLGEYIIGNIDEDGYLRRNLESITDDLAFTYGMEVSYEKLHEVLMIIQESDPAGVGARSLRECLMLQLEREGLDDPVDQVAYNILNHHFDEFTNKHYDKIIQRLSITREQLKEALDIVLRLNPKPGSSYGESQVKSFHQIVPDFILEYNDGKLELFLNSSNVPELRLSRTYTEMLE